MIWVITLSILNVLLIVGVVALVYFLRQNEEKSPENRHKKLEEGQTFENVRKIKKSKYLFVLLTPLIWILIIFGSITTVGANEVGIIYDQLNGGVLEETYGQGFHLKSPFRKVTTISTTNKTAFLEVNAQTSDSIYALFEITITYKIETENAGRFYRVVGATNITAEQLNSVIKEALQSVSTTYDIFAIMGEELDVVREKVYTTLSQHLKDRYHITLISLSIDDVDAGDRVEQIIQEKAEAIQRIQIAQQEKQKAEIEAQTALIRAENEASIALLKAEANAEAQQLLNSVAVTAIQNMYNSQFPDEASKIEFETSNVGGYLNIQEISEIVIKQLYYDVWDGKLPTVVSDGNGIIIQP